MFILFTGTYLRDHPILLMDAAIEAIGVLGKTYSLPLLAEEEEDKLSKKAIVDVLFSVLSNVKLNTKVCLLFIANCLHSVAHTNLISRLCFQMKEKAALSLGYLCVGERFPHTAVIANGILATVKEVREFVVLYSIKFDARLHFVVYI